MKRTTGLNFGSVGKRAAWLPLVCAIAASSALAQVPTPESVLGYKPGADFHLTNYEDSLGYFRKLAAASNKVKLVNVGKSTQGRDWWIAFISEPENLKQMDHYKEISRRLALSRGVSDEQAHALAHELKPFIHIDGGLHATEVANFEHTIQLGYDLATSEEPEFKSIRQNLIVELWFSINPDGQSAVANWYMGNVGTQYEVSPMPQLFQEYVGHDNNRDGYMLNMVESRTVTKATLETQPLVFYTQHQTAPFPGRIYLPPFADPISGNMHPYMVRWLNLIGMSIAQYLDDHNLPGSMHQETFDVWYPGYLDNVGNFRHTISFFTETALYRYATPHFYTVDEFPAARQGLGEEMLYSSPWKGGWWRIGDACKYMYEADMAVLNLSNKYREQLAYNKYRAARETIEKFTKEPPFAYEIPRQQRDAPTASLLLEKLMLNGIEVHQSTTPDAWVVLMDQPFAGLVKELFEPQVYPPLTQRPYDVTGWTLPMQMGVEAHSITTPLSKQYRDSLRVVHEITGLAAPFQLSANASYRAINEILAAKGAVSLNGDQITASGLDSSKLNAILTENRLRADTPKEAGKAIHAARVGLYRPWTASMDEGWTRWIFEQFKFPFANLYNADIRGGHLKEHYDTILIPDMSENQILNGYRPGTIPERYAGGLGEDGVQELRDFVDAGGTLVTFNSASLFAINQFKLPVENAIAGTNAGNFFCSGCLVSVHLEDTKNSQTAGMAADTIVMFERGPVFTTKNDFKGKVLARYPSNRNPLESGYLAGPEKIEGKIAALSAEVGKGHVILLGFKPQWRGQSHAAYKFFFNAMYLGE
ncbi:MAG TPA: M14 metallopeptidase family protein [Bryobacteraceae bacterium]|nr:M14 metallopeptidase family protein [Bryobacteraceae bacterium]